MPRWEPVCHSFRIKCKWQPDKEEAKMRSTGPVTAKWLWRTLNFQRAVEAENQAVSRIQGLFSAHFCLTCEVESLSLPCFSFSCSSSYQGGRGKQLTLLSVNPYGPTRDGRGEGTGSRGVVRPAKPRARVELHPLGWKPPCSTNEWTPPSGDAIISLEAMG